MTPPSTERTNVVDAMPVTPRLEDFDQDSGSLVERLIFKHRLAVVLASALVTALLGWIAATRHVVNADYDAMVPTDHPFVRNQAEHREHLRGLGNSLYVALEARRGDIYDPAYQEALRDLTDELVLLPGADRAWVRSLWTPAVRWTETTDDGFRGGPVVPEDYDGSAAAMLALRRNVGRAGVVGSLVAKDQRSSLVFVPLVDRDAGGGEALSYGELARRLAEVQRGFERRSGGAYVVHAVGFAKLVGDLLDGMRAVTAWFAVAAAIAAAVVYLYTRCIRSTALVVACSALAVVWQLGIVCGLGLRLDPFSMLVPFLVFALGISHGTQKMNGIAQDVARGTHRLVAARYTFRRLFVAGLTALLTDAVGFAALALIAIPAIRQMALTATIGAGVLVFTNLVLLPVALSFTGVRGSRDDGGARAGGGLPWSILSRFVERRWAVTALAVTGVALASAAAVVARGGPGAERGASELRRSSSYNRDAEFIAASYDVSADVFAVIVKTPADGCLDPRTIVETDRLGWALQQAPAVRTTVSLPDAVRRITAESFEGDPKWLTLSRDRHVTNYAAQQAISRNPDLVDPECSVLPVVAYLSDHGPGSLDAVVRIADAFARTHSTGERAFLLAAGNAGMLAATNMAVRDARWVVAACVYAAVVLLCFLVFRSWRPVLVTMIPIAVTSLLCDALMTLLGVRLTLTTLPVISLGVGIPDFALYLLSVQLAHQRAGEPLARAWSRSLGFTGRAVMLVGAMLSAGVVTWAWSPLKVQADMGVLLAFMFLGNMVAALTLVPALSCFLLRDAPARAAPSACADEGARAHVEVAP